MIDIKLKVFCRKHGKRLLLMLAAPGDDTLCCPECDSKVMLDVEVPVGIVGFFK